MTKYTRKLHSVEHLGEDNFRLIELISILQDSIPNRNGSQAIADVLKALVDYAKYHFPREEELMRKYKYIDYERHRAKHQEFIKQVSQILMRLKGDKEVTVYELISFLKKWVDDHLIIEDLKFKRAAEANTANV
jgi:hemerythrin